MTGHKTETRISISRNIQLNSPQICGLQYRLVVYWSDQEGQKHTSHHILELFLSQLGTYLPIFKSVAMRKMLSHFLVLYSIFFVLRTTFSFKSFSRATSPLTSNYLSYKSTNPTSYPDPSLINQITFDTALNMASMYGNVLGGDLTKVGRHSSKQPLQ